MIMSMILYIILLIVYIASNNDYYGSITLVTGYKFISVPIKYSRYQSLSMSITSPNQFPKRNSNRDYKPIENKVQSTDSWKVLTSKLETIKNSKEKFGKINKISTLIDTPDELQCRHFDVCAGCTVRGKFNETLMVKKARNFFTTQNIDLKLHIGNTTQWRTHVKLAVQPLSKWGGLKFGLYKSGTHTVEAIPDCRVHHPRINEAIQELHRNAVDLNIKGYVEASNGLPSQGELRYLQMSVDRVSGRIQLTLVWNTETFKESEQTLPRLVKRLKCRSDLWHSVTVNFQTSDSNTIFNYHPKAWKTLWGPPLLREKVGDAYFYFLPQIFRQANLDAFESGIVPTVLKNIPEGVIVAELYSGIGLIGLNVAKKASEVFCSDSNEYIDSVFDKCADSLAEANKEKVYFECMSAEEAVLEGQCDEASVLIVDPPRKGLDEGVIKLLTGTHPEKEAPELKRLIYISCGFEALEKDTRTILASGRWKIKSADGFLLFPGSDHIESVVVYDRTNI